MRIGFFYAHSEEKSLNWAHIPALHMLLIQPPVISTVLDESVLTSALF
jgi:hypothetical protein